MKIHGVGDGCTVELYTASYTGKLLYGARSLYYIPYIRVLTCSHRARAHSLTAHSPTVTRAGWFVDPGATIVPVAPLKPLLAALSIDRASVGIGARSHSLAASSAAVATAEAARPDRRAGTRLPPRRRSRSRHIGNTNSTAAKSLVKVRRAVKVRKTESLKLSSAAAL